MKSSGSARGSKRSMKLYHTMTLKKRTSSQALKQQSTSRPTLSQRLKLQARVNKLQNFQARVQANKSLFRGTGNKHKGIFRMFHVKGNLVRQLEIPQVLL